MNKLDILCCQQTIASLQSIMQTGTEDKILSECVLKYLALASLHFITILNHIKHPEQQDRIFIISDVSN